MKRPFLFFFFFSIAYACCGFAAAPSPVDWQEALRLWMDVEEMEDGYGEETLELLADIADNKLNLNLLTRDELEQLPFLTAQQVEGIIAYRDRYAPVRSLSELQMVTSLDRDTRRLLAYFVYVGDAPPKRVWPTLSEVQKGGVHTLMATVKVPLYERKGDRNGYLGYPWRHDFRYQFTYRDRVKFGLTAAQDAGEPFLANANRWGYDHYSYYFQLRGMGRLEELNVGMYRVQCGMGLVMNTGFYLGKLAALQSLGRSAHVLTTYASRSAANYLQGAAATVRLADHWKVTAFASCRPLDATLNDDGTVRTVVTDGYHRTPTELSKKNNTLVSDLGVRLSFRPSSRKGQSFLNVNAVYTHFNRPLRPLKENAPYRRYALEGASFFNASADYGYTNARLSFSGETAVNADGALAALHVLSYRATDQLSLMALHRYYDRRYTAFHACSFSEGSSVQNEHGLYGGITWRPSRGVIVQGYADYAFFPWKRYLISASSEAFDALARVRVYNNRWNVEGLYRFHLRQRDNQSKTLLQNRYEHRFRLRADHAPSQSFSISGQADAVYLPARAGGDAASASPSRGVMLSGQTKWRHRWLTLNASLGWFRTDDYDSRLFVYERSVQYDFSFPSYYGHGIRYALMAQASLHRFLLAAKFSVTDYFDRAVISSGLQQVDCSSLPELLVQLRVRI